MRKKKYAYNRNNLAETFEKNLTIMKIFLGAFR